MRLLRIFSLLFSLGQFLLILKLIELVRGNPTTPSPQLFQNSDQIVKPSGRSFFLAPSKVKQKNYRLWGQPTTTETPTTDLTIDRLGIENDEEYQFEPMNATASNASILKPLSNSSIIVSNAGEEPQPSSSEGRLCPGCEGGVCGGNLSSYGFPVIPVVVAIVVGIIWFFVFLFLWYFATRPLQSRYGEAASEGYGYEGNEQSGWSSSMGSADSILDLFKGGGHQRTFQTFNDLTVKITDALSNLATLYNST